MTDAGRARAAHRQQDFAVRFDWGPTGADAIAAGAQIAVVVDVLSFTTTLTIAVERGMTVFPYRWADEGAAAYAEQRDATLAVGRFEAGPDNSTPTLSPAHLLNVEAVPRLVLPSPNGSSISFALAESGATVIGASLRNATAVAAHLHAHHRANGHTIAVVAAGERWPDGSLRPCAEDLWGAGAVLAELARLDPSGFSPEAELAAAAYDAVAGKLPERLAQVAGARELQAVGFGEDVRVASEYAVSATVPVLRGDAFVAAT